MECINGTVFSLLGRWGGVRGPVPNALDLCSVPSSRTTLLRQQQEPVRAVDAMPARYLGWRAPGDISFRSLSLATSTPFLQIKSR